MRGRERGQTGKGRRAVRREWSVPLLSLNGVAVLLLAAFSVFPLLYVCYLSVVDLRAGQAVGSFVGLDNYRFVLENDSTIIAFRNTLYFSTLTVIVATLIGAAIAFVTSTEAWFARLLLPAAILPWAVPEVVNALMWKWIFDFHWGALNAVLHGLGLIEDHRAWFSEGTSAMHALILAYAWKLVPFVVITLYAALKSIPTDVIEAARVDGAGEFALFWRIRLPLIIPALAVSVLLCVIFSMRAFDLIYLLTRGGPGEATTVLSYHVYTSTFEFGDVGSGASISVFLAVVTMAVTLAYWWIFNKLEREQ
ncbi:carbohydrate ABC transporter permease [Bosea sp. (in: a-proteobacteria)]|uniref:carbohydrate ABC transporter permease n=1 Tax=Bosea sp. (in: a-proteobacteria) TaxID=1871050 RepID=UPI00262CE40A|nr:sugar ABC transporter permease [Bosea sp. (in: a-proteobacteria)]MCO5089552.1 sugar ABC transporter permease [Bosea sp. (in: a-proteobacteria)]